MQRSKQAADSRTRSRSPRRYSHSLQGNIKEWGQGILTGPRFWQSAYNLHLDYGSQLGIDRIVGGIYDSSDQNIHRHLMHVFGTTLGFDRLLTTFTSDLISAGLLPSQLFRLVFKHNRATFLRIYGFSENLEQYWEQLFSTPDGRAMRFENPSLRGKTPFQLRHTAPVTLHEDAGPFAKQSSCNLIQYSAVTAKGKDYETKLLYASFLKNTSQPASFGADAYEAFFDDMQQLATGYDKEGKPYASDGDTVYALALSWGKCDGEQSVNEWGLQTHGGKDECCGLCLADRAGRPFSNLHSDSPWRGTEYVYMDKATFCARCKHGHPVERSPFWGRFFYRQDIMHQLDNNGVASIVAGSVLVKRTQNPALGANQTERLKQINSELDIFYSDHIVSSRLPKLLLQNLTIKQSNIGRRQAFLSGQVVKAANTRCVMPFISILARKYIHGSDFVSSSIRKLCESLCAIYECLYSAGYFLSDEQLKFLEKHVLRFGRHFMVACNSDDPSSSILMFCMRPKVHQMQHLPLQARLHNPRFLQCYGEESFVGVMCKVWAASKSGPQSQATIQRTVLIKYLCFLCVALGL